MPSQLTKIATEKSATQLQMMSRQSYKWMMDKINNIRSPSRIAAGINREVGRSVTKFQIGGLYFFYYNPKLKDDLPYYDTFPLVLVLERYPDGFLGLNLHYLPLNYRVAFMDKLMPYAVQTDTNEIQRMRISYDILNASKTFREFRPCTKKYLYNHVTSKILAVQPNEWETAVFLPAHQFKKMPVSKVWQESLDQIRK